MFERGEMRELPTNLKCDICGKQFASSYAKQKHMEGHFIQLRKRGLTPRFLHDSKTGDTIFKGMKPVDIW